jgi:SP family sugar:H+ symporter-like MFS transporter
VIFLLTLFFIPESPRYLVMKGHEDRALAVLTRLFGAEGAAAKVAEIRASLTVDHRPRLSDTLKTGAAKAPLWLAYALLAIIVALCVAGVLPYIWGVPVALLVIAFVVPFRPIVRVGIGLAVFQQLVGINIVFYYGTSLWQAVGFSEQAAFQMNSLGGLMSIPACIVALLVIDRLGRRPMLLIGSAGMAVTLFIMVYAFSTGTVGANDTLHLSDTNGVIALVAAVAYAMFFNFSWGPVMWVMLGEMFPNQLRGSGLAVAGLMQWAANFAISSTFPVLKSQAGLAPAYTFYAVSAVVSYFFVMKFVTETRGKELEAMEG